MKIELASEKDLTEILKLQKQAFQIQAEIYNDFNIPPLTQSLKEFKLDFSNHVLLKAIINDRIIGSVRANKIEDTCYIGRLIVNPDFHDRGIGTKLMNEIESLFKESRRFELFTGHLSQKNLHLYEKLGYKRFKSEKIHENLEMIFLEKLKIKFY